MLNGYITRISENPSGYEFGIIAIYNSNNETYYFDDRYLEEGTMADFNEDDEVSFVPRKDIITGHLSARKVKHNLSSSDSNVNIKNDTKDSEAYIDPTISDNQSSWFEKGRTDNLIIREFSEEEAKILDKLALAFFHTNAGHFRPPRGSMKYGYSLFGPTKQFAIQLGLEKVEFVAILCDKKDFQRRTIDEAIVTNLPKSIPKTRIVGHFYFLITKYKDIVLEIEKPEIQKDIEQSIIPFSYDELIMIDDAEINEFLLKRMKKFLFERDFFSYSEPIKDRLFLFGAREQYAKSITDRSISGEHSGVFGLRKSGKTSVLNAVKQELTQRRVFHLSYRCIELALYEWFQALYRISKDAYIKSGRVLNSVEYTAINAMENFINDINNLLELQEYQRIILIFDEIEQIAFDTSFEKKWQSPNSFHFFWSTFITFCEKYDRKLSLIIAGINPSISEKDVLPAKASVRNPMYQKLSNDNYLSPFAMEQIKRMVNNLGKYMGLTFHDEVCFELHKDFGGHPFFTRQMCKLINKHIMDNGLRKEQYMFEIARPLYNAVKDSPSYEVAFNEWCKDILKELRTFYNDEYQLLLKIANKDNEAVNKVKNSQKYIPHLIGYGLIQYDPVSNEMDVKISVLRQYLIGLKEYVKPFNEMTRDEIDDEIKEGIRDCERPLRNLIYDVLSTQIQPSAMTDFFKGIKRYADDNKDNDFRGLNLRELLDPSLVVLHFYILKEIICSYPKDQFGDRFRFFKIKLHPYTKQDIKSFLDNIYVARNPADHHYNVYNEGTLANFRNSLVEIKKILKSHGYI